MARFASTTTPLTANEIKVIDFDAGREDNLVGSIFADQAGVLHIEQSMDGGANWDITRNVAVAAGVPQVFSEAVVWPKMRLRYVNGGVAQGAFRLGARFSSTGYRG
jgi:hypothetical protein